MSKLTVKRSMKRVVLVLVILGIPLILLVGAVVNRTHSDPYEETLVNDEIGSARELSDTPKLVALARIGTPSIGDDTDHEFGTLIHQSDTNTPGVFAIQEVNTTLSLSPGQWLYAPTLLSPNNSRYEAVTAYYHTGEDTARGFYIWDHVLDRFVVLKHFDDTEFMDAYVRPCAVGQCYQVIVMKDLSGKWHVLLWNFTRGAWEDQVTPMPGSSRFVDGWNLWEYNPGEDCSSLPRVETYSLKVYTSSGWQSVTSSYGSKVNIDLSCNPYGWLN